MPKTPPTKYAEYLKLARDFDAGKLVSYPDPSPPGGEEAGGRRALHQFASEVELELFNLWKGKRTKLPNPLLVLRARSRASAARHAPPELKIVVLGDGRVSIDDDLVDEKDVWREIISRWRPSPGDVRLLIPINMTLDELYSTLDLHQENLGIEDISHSRKTPELLLTFVPYLILYYHELGPKYSYQKCARLFLDRSGPAGKKEAERMANAAKAFIKKTFPK